MEISASKKLANDVVLGGLTNKDLVRLEEVCSEIMNCVDFALSFGDDMSKHRIGVFNEIGTFTGSLSGRFSIELELRRLDGKE